MWKAGDRARVPCLAALAAAAAAGGGSPIMLPSCTAFSFPKSGGSLRRYGSVSVVRKGEAIAGVDSNGALKGFRRKVRVPVTAKNVAIFSSTTALEPNTYTIVADDNGGAEAPEASVHPVRDLANAAEYFDPALSLDISSEMPVAARRKRKAGGKAPELVIEGDKLVNTPKMLGLVYSSLALLAAYFVQGLSTVTSPWEAILTAVGLGAGLLLADLVSGVFHWSVDNYGNGTTPVFGAVIEAFQGHHASPWTITYRPFENNVHKICYAVLPLLALLRLVNPGPAGVAFGVTFLFGSLMSQELHRYAHMISPPPVAAVLQDWGVIISRLEHGRHHRSPFEDKYCIVTGACNDILDKTGAFRFLERVIFQMNGVEPICWQLNPALKEDAMSGKGAWFPNR